ncbi:hypothetical protein BCR44DRAFT_1431318 [Catenaria anguillulae PL171]|uniref:Uncharacterized protein n=1 Tax=Catenaria anguillulae PL171 TaxID=765915 RepID=A0A1Y2HV77_9FUNG|nr:hypothetical protein BCR44DRAFT_1431318 [Catenaria anguillulae PL171]
MRSSRATLPSRMYTTRCANDFRYTSCVTIIMVMPFSELSRHSRSMMRCVFAVSRSPLCRIV